EDLARPGGRLVGLHHLDSGRTCEPDDLDRTHGALLRRGGRAATGYAHGRPQSLTEPGYRRVTLVSAGAPDRGHPEPNQAYSCQTDPDVVTTPGEPRRGGWEDSSGRR